MTGAGRALPWLFWLMLAVIPFFEGPKNTLFVLAALAWLAARGWRHDPGPLRWAGWLALVALLSAITAISPREALNGAFDYFRIFLCGLLALAVVRATRDALVTLAVIAGATALAAAVAMARVALGYANFGSAGLSILSLGFSNQAAAYLVLALVAQMLLLARAFAPAAPAGWRAPLLPLAVMLPTLAALWLTSSRGAWVAAALLLLLFVVRHGTRRLVLGLLLLTLLLTPLLRTQMAAEQLTSVTGVVHVLRWRAALWLDCVPVIMEHAWLGVGPRNFTNLDPERYLRGWEYSNHAHNLLVNPAVEMGLPGLGCLLALLLAPLGFARRLPAEWRFLPQGAVLALFVTGMITTTYQTEAGMLFAALIGTAVGIARLSPASRL